MGKDVVLLPPIAIRERAPRRFRELISAAQGRLTGIVWLLNFYRDLLSASPPPSQEPAKLSEVLRGINSVEQLGTRYASMKNFGVGDLLYYLRLGQSFGLFRVFAVGEAARKLDEFLIQRTVLSDTVSEAAEIPEAALMFSMYSSLLFDTPARHVMFVGQQQPSIAAVALDPRFWKAYLYNAVLAAQTLLQSTFERILPEGRGRPWFEPISDISGIAALLAALQVSNVRPEPGKLLGVRMLSKARRSFARELGAYSEYVLPRGTLVLELDRIVNGRASDELTGFDYRRILGDERKDLPWFRTKLTSRTYTILERVVKSLKQRREEIMDDFRQAFNLTFRYEAGR